MNFYIHFFAKTISVRKSSIFVSSAFGGPIYKPTKNINMKAIRVSCYFIAIILFSFSCKKSSTESGRRSDSNSEPFISVVLKNSNGTNYYNDTFKIKYTLSQAGYYEPQSNPNRWKYAAQDAYQFSKSYTTFYLKNKAEIKSYNTPILSELNVANPNDYSLLLYSISDVNYNNSTRSAVAKTGTFSITKTEPVSASTTTPAGVKISGSWSGIATVTRSDGSVGEYSGEVRINNITYYE
jgi:hypothetical protein